MTESHTLDDIPFDELFVEQTQYNGAGDDGRRNGESGIVNLDNGGGGDNNSRRRGDIINNGGGNTSRPRGRDDEEQSGTNIEGERSVTVTVTVPNRMPDLSEFVKQLDQRLHADADDNPGSQINVILKRRKYTPALTRETKTAIYTRLKSMEYQLRVAYLLCLTDDALEDLIEHNFGDITGIDAANVHEYAASRIKGNCANWQYRCIGNLMAFNEKLCTENSLYVTCQELGSIRKVVAQKYSLELFTEVFDFVNEYIDLGKSGPDVQKWCKILFIELASRAKLTRDYENNQASLRLSDHDRPSLIYRFKTICSSKQMSTYRPDPAHIYRFFKPRSSKKSQKEGRKFRHPDDDEDIYVPSN